MRNIYFALFSLFPFFVFGQNQNIVTPLHDFDVSSQVVSPHHDSEVSVAYSAGFPNCQFQDLSGNNYDIYSELNQGKTVVLAFMNYFTSMCQNEVKYLNHIKDVYEEGEDMIRLWAIEKSNHNMINSAGVNLNTLYSEWGFEYPLMNIDGFTGQYAFLNTHVTSVPTYIVIAPDQSYSIISAISYEEDILSYLNQNILTANNINANYDVDLYNVEHDYCNGNVNLYLSIQNTGLSTHAGLTVTLSTTSGDIIDSFYLDNTLAPKARVELSLLYGANQILNTDFNVEITSSYSNENHRNNKSAVSLEESLNTSGNIIRLELHTDNYPAETAWHLRNNTLGEYVDSAGLGVNGQIVGLSQGLHSYDFTLVDNHCYTLHIYDSYGDGICCTNGDGYFKIYDIASNSLIHEGGNFQLSDKAHFRILPEVVGLVDELENQVTKEILSIDYFDILGRKYTSPKKNTIMLKRTVYTDNSIKSEKIHLK